MLSNQSHAARRVTARKYDTIGTGMKSEAAHHGRQSFPSHGALSLIVTEHFDNAGLRHASDSKYVVHRVPDSLECCQPSPRHVIVTNTVRGFNSGGCFGLFLQMKVVHDIQFIVHGCSYHGIARRREES